MFDCFYLVVYCHKSFKVFSTPSTWERSYPWEAYTPRADEAVAHVVAGAQGGLGVAAVVGIHVHGVGGPAALAASTKAVVTA